MFKLWSLALALLVGAGFWAAPAMAGSSEVEELERQIADLRNEVDGLKSVDRQGGDEGSPMTTALKNHVFSWSTEDGKFAFSMQTDVKVRLTYNDERGGGDHGQNARDFINFSIPLADTTFKGHIFEKEYQYKLQVSWNATDGNNMIKDAYFTWAKFKFLNVNVGQHKLAFNWEKMTSDTKQKFIDRSVVNAMFHEDYAKGLWLNGEFGEDTPWVRYWIGIYNGVLRGATDFRNRDRAIRGDTFADQAVDNDMMLNLRVETHPMGEVEKDMQDMRGEDERSKIIFAVGLGFNWFVSRHPANNVRPDIANSAFVLGTNPGTAADTSRARTGHDTMTLVLDGHLRWMGLSFDFEFFFRHTEFHNYGANNSTKTFNSANHGIIGNNDDLGFSMEIGYMVLPNQLGLGFRWGHFDADEHWVPGASTSTHRLAFAPDMDEYGLVVNYYLAGHNLKGQFDFTYVVNQLAFDAGGYGLNSAVPTTVPSRGGTGTNDLMESDYEEAWQLRLQIQWIF